MIIASVRHIITHVLHVSVSLALLIATASLWLSPAKVPISPWFGILFEALAGAEILLLLIRLCTPRRRWAWLSIATLLIAIIPLLHTVSHQAIVFPKKAPSHSLRVMTYNTHRMSDAAKPKQNRIIQFILRTNPDIVCLQEVEVTKSEAHLTLPELRQAFADYPYSYFDFKIYNSRRQYGNAVFSRYPLIKKHTLRFESRGNITSVCDIVLPTDTLRLYTNHLESNRLPAETGNLPATSEEAQTALSQTSLQLTKASALRAAQADALHEDISQSPHPVIVVGDLNTTPVSYTYHTIQRGLRDAFLTSSNLQFGHTFLRHGIGIRIDYILHSPTLRASDCEIPQVDYSDHYPVIATIQY